MTIVHRKTESYHSRSLLTGTKTSPSQTIPLSDHHGGGTYHMFVHHVQRISTMSTSFEE